MFVAAMKPIPSDYCELTEGFQKVVKKVGEIQQSERSCIQKGVQHEFT